MKTSGNPPRRLRDRILLMAGLVAYILAFQWMYVSYLYDFIGSDDFQYHPPGVGYMILAWGLSLLPGIWMPLSLTRPSQLAYWVLYIIVIIPSIFVSFYIGLNRPGEIACLVLTLFLGFLILGSSYLLPLLPIRPRPVSHQVFWSGLICLVLGFTIWILIVFRGNLTIASFAHAYDVRFATHETARGSFVDYALQILSASIDPFLIAWGLHYRRAGFVIAGILGQVLVYSAAAYKVSIVSIVYIFLVYLVLRPSRISFAVKIVWGATVVLIATLLSFFAVGESPGPVHWLTLHLIFGRIFTINGLMTGQWYYFFQHHPLTYYSHVRVLKWFAPPYPYADGVGNEIGYFYSGNIEYGATTHFWATDGLAALGLPGILLISVLGALVFWLLDSVSKKHDPRLAALIISYVSCWNLANNGLFNSLLSGGLALLMLILYVLPGEDGKGPLTPPLLKNGSS